MQAHQYNHGWDQDVSSAVTLELEEVDLVYRTSTLLTDYMMTKKTQHLQWIPGLPYVMMQNDA